MESPGLSIIVFGPFRLSVSERVLFRGAEPVDLTPKAFDTLLILVERAGRVVSKDELMRLVWPDTAVEENNLTQNISRLRKLLGDGSNGREFIETIPRRGYRFLADVRHLHDPTHELLFRRRTRWSYVTEEAEEDTGDVDRGHAGPTGAPEPQPAAAESVHGIAPSNRLTMRRPLVAGAIIAGGAAAALGLWRLAARPPGVPTAERFGGMAIGRLTSSGNVVAGAISPDGKYVVHAVSDGGWQALWVKQVATGSDVQIVPPAPVDYWGVTLSADSSFVYYVAWERNKTDAVLYRVPILGGARRKLIQGADGAVGFSPGGHRLVFGITRSSRNESVLMTANAGGTDHTTLAAKANGEIFNGASTSGPAWSPDGRGIASALGRTVSGYRRQQLVHIGIDGTEPRPIGSRLWINMGRIAWLPDGRGLLFSARDRVDSPDQLLARRLPGGRGNASDQRPARLQPRQRYVRRAGARGGADPDGIDHLGRPSGRSESRPRGVFRSRRL